MKTLGIDDGTNDIVFQNGILVIADGLESVASRCTNIMQTLRGEMSLRADGGMAYRELVWESTDRLAIFMHEARTRILQEPDITEVVGMRASYENNILSYEMEIYSDYSIQAVLITGEGAYER